jgi:hypothetical protein
VDKAVRLRRIDAPGRGADAVCGSTRRAVVDHPDAAALTLSAAVSRIHELETALCHAQAERADAAQRADRAEKSCRDAWAFRTSDRPWPEGPHV